MSVAVGMPNVLIGSDMSEHSLLEHRVSLLETGMREIMGEIRDGIREIAINTGKLAILEERHAETRDGLVSLRRDHHGIDVRLRSMEIDMPGLREIRKWVVAGVLAIVVIVGGAVISVVVDSPSASVRHGR